MICFKLRLDHSHLLLLPDSMMEAWLEIQPFRIPRPKLVAKIEPRMSLVAINGTVEGAKAPAALISSDVVVTSNSA